MKHWKTAALIVALVAAAIVPAGTVDAAAEKTVLCTATMWAGQHTDVGTVVVSMDGDDYYVYYQTHSGWTLGTVHVHVASEVAGVPQNKGGPIPGKFRYQAEASGDRIELKIPCSKLPAGKLTILAHAETFGPGGCSEDCQLELPLGLVQACLSTDDLSYITHTISGAGDLDGVYEGWCVDLDGRIGLDCYDVTMVSSLDAANNDVIARPENWDLINYLLNRVSSWRDQQGATLYDLQWVFWQLSDFDADLPFLPTDPDLADEILFETVTNGEGFVPGSGDVVAVVMVHAEGNLQETIIGVPLDCPPMEGGEETAWAGELEFPGKNWARYFTCEGCR